MMYIEHAFFKDSSDRLVCHRAPLSGILLQTGGRVASSSSSIAPYNFRVNKQLKRHSVTSALKTLSTPHNLQFYQHHNFSNNLIQEENYELMQVGGVKTRDNFQIPESAEECSKATISQHKTNYHDCGHFVINFKENHKDFVPSSEKHSTDEEELEYIIARVPKKRNQKFTCQKTENSFKIPNSKNSCKRPVPGVIAIEKFCSQQFKINLAQKKSAYLARKQYSRGPQMGFDIISRLRQLLNFNPSVNQQSNALENNRKRRSEDSRELTIIPQRFKYRKVDNKFPKYIASTTGNDMDDVLPSTSNKLLNNRKTDTNSDVSIIPLPHSLNTFDKSNFRKSMFVAPEVTRILIKNSNDSSIELSDYDEFQDELTVVKEYKPKKLEKKSCTNVCKIPIMQRVKHNLKSTNQTTIIQNNRLTFPEKHDGYVVTGRNSIHKNVSSNRSTIGPSHILNGLSCVSTISLPSNAHSILVQEKRTEERLKYQQFLQKVMSPLYENSNESGSPKNFIRINGKNPLLRNTKTKSTVMHALPSTNKHSNQWQLKPRSLLDSFNLDEDEVESNVIIDEMPLKSSLKKEKANVPTYVIDGDEDPNESDKPKDCKGGGHDSLKLQADNELSKICKKSCKSTVLPQVARVNSFQEHVECVPCLKDDWFGKIEAKWDLIKSNRRVQCKEAAMVSDKLYAERRVTENEVLVKLSNFKIIDVDLLGVDESEESVPEPEFVELTSDQRTRINAVIFGPPDQVLVSKFNLNITRRDIHTLCGHNWLNDEVINFYMNLLTERGDRKHESHGMPKVYAMNTFFMPRLMQAGYAGVKRWTRKVDIFTKDIIPVPVHVGGVHWCMAIIHIKQSSIKYYDSMGTPNPNVLKALEQYLKDESLDKHKQTFDTTGFLIESVADVPRQMNGSDCGVFSCMFAEYITRNRQITFTQQNMEFFRQKMILEIIRGELLQ